MKTELGNSIGMEIGALENTATTWQSLNQVGILRILLSFTALLICVLKE